MLVRQMPLQCLVSPIRKMSLNFFPFVRTSNFFCISIWPVDPQTWKRLFIVWRRDEVYRAIFHFQRPQLRFEAQISTENVKSLQTFFLLTEC